MTSSSGPLANANIFLDIFCMLIWTRSLLGKYPTMRDRKLKGKEGELQPVEDSAGFKQLLEYVRGPCRIVDLFYAELLDHFKS